MAPGTPLQNVSSPTERELSSDSARTRLSLKSSSSYRVVGDKASKNESHVAVSLSLSLLATEDRTNLAGRPSYHSNLFTGADSYHCRRDSCRYRSDNLPFSFAGLGFNGGIRSDSLLLSITGASTRGMSVTVPRIESEVSFAACVGRKVWSFSFPRPTPLEDAIFIFLRGPGE